jgi:hypothetical protein
MEKVIFGPDIIDEAKATVHRIHDNLKAAKSRQETYAMSYPVPRKKERSLHTCAQDVQITRMVTI